MSTSVDYLFNFSGDLHELSAEINNCLGSNLRVSKPHDTEQAWARLFGMSLDLYAHSFEGTVREIELSTFKYYLSLSGPKDVAVMKVPLIAEIAYLLYLQLDVKAGLLVFDLQRLLALYEIKIFEDGYEALYDSVSEKRVVFPEHFVDIDSLID